MSDTHSAQQDSDYIRFATFLKHQADDPQYDAAFRARFDSVTERSSEQVQIVHSIWRINTANRQLIDVVLARLHQDNETSPTTRLFSDVAKFGIESFQTLKTPATCDITREIVEYPRQIRILGGERSWTIRSDLMRIVRFFHVVAHFVECTTVRFRHSSETSLDILFDDHYREWQCCRTWVKTLSDTIESLPKNALNERANNTTHFPAATATPHLDEAMSVDT